MAKIWESLVGQKFGHLTVLSLSEKKLYNERWWLCKCGCGEEVLVRTTYLKSKGQESCGCFFGEKFVGKKFGRLLIIEDSKEIDKNGVRVVLCKCECGRISKKKLHTLVSGKTTGCKCSQQENFKKAIDSRILPDNEGAFNHLFYSYKRSAKNRNLSWTLEKEAFKNLTHLDCYYCGKPPIQEYKRSDSSSYLYNGIDRIDNLKGYSPENSVSCCGICNTAKSDMTLSKYNQWLSSLIAHQLQKRDKLPNIYLLRRLEDIHGTSGTGIVAIIIKMPSGKCLMEWYGKHKTETIFDSLDQILELHGHEGKTVIIPFDLNVLDEEYSEA